MYQFKQSLGCLMVFVKVLGNTFKKDLDQ